MLTDPLSQTLETFHAAADNYNCQLVVIAGTVCCLLVVSGVGGGG